MNEREAAAVLLIGAPGSGKSSVAGTLGTLLETEDVAYGGIETDLLSWGWPWLTLEQWLPQLRSLIALERQAGRRLHLVVATPETDAELEAIVDALDAERVVVVCLTAPADLVANRVAHREPDSWPGKAMLEQHARALADAIPRLAGIDVVLSTRDRRPADVALDVRRQMVRIGLA